MDATMIVFVGIALVVLGFVISIPALDPLLQLLPPRLEVGVMTISN